ncbi:uncharacterized protein LOC110257797 isoform X2 [Sus scrofa]|uniref:uncharacterized protein LOC110257797 isoform X2 n=1 Tax=Sus scrofa TaxID=9823 RepID=UPI000A2AFF40|nr:uncharacterized protein LOC110257797 isoform X2 [Sus scrofa]
MCSLELMKVAPRTATCFSRSETQIFILGVFENCQQPHTDPEKSISPQELQMPVVAFTAHKEFFDYPRILLHRDPQARKFHLKCQSNQEAVHSFGFGRGRAEEEGCSRTLTSGAPRSRSTWKKTGQRGSSSARLPPKEWFSTRGNCTPLRQGTPGNIWRRFLVVTPRARGHLVGRGRRCWWRRENGTQGSGDSILQETSHTPEKSAAALKGQPSPGWTHCDDGRCDFSNLVELD